MAVAGRALVGLPEEELHHVAGPVAPLHPPGGAEDLLRREEGLVVGEGAGLPEADVAGAAARLLTGDGVRGRPGGAEVLRQEAVAADRRRGEAADVAELALQRALAVGGELPVLLRQGAVEDEVGDGEEQRALRREAVAAGAAGFLLVVLHGARRVGVDDEAHVGAVDAHAEGDGGDDDGEPLVHEGLLRRPPLRRGEAGVVGGAGDAGLRQGRGEALHVAPGLGVDDAPLPLVAADGGDHLGRGIGAGEGAVDEVGAVRVADETDGVAERHAERDVVPHLRRGRGREGHAGGLREAVQHLGEAAVLGAELVAPVGDAVGLVHGGQRHAGADEGEEVAEEEALGAHVEETGLPRREAAPGLPPVGGLEVGVERVGGEARLPGGVHLVVHERDEGGDDEDEAPVQRRRKLVAEALPAPRGEHDEGIAAREGGFDGLPLEGLEGVVAPVAAEGLREFHGEGMVSGGRDGAPVWCRRLTAAAATPPGSRTGPPPGTPGPGGSSPSPRGRPRARRGGGPRRRRAWTS